MEPLVQAFHRRGERRTLLEGRPVELRRLVGPSLALGEKALRGSAVRRILEPLACLKARLVDPLGVEQQADQAQSTRLPPGVATGARVSQGLPGGCDGAFPVPLVLQDLRQDPVRVRNRCLLERGSRLALGLVEPRPEARGVSDGVGCVMTGALGSVGPVPGCVRT